MMENFDFEASKLNLKSLAFYSRQIVEGFMTGLHRSPFHGFSVEFSEHRPYNSGESTRNIDWRLYGRSDKLFVKQYAEETNLRCHIVIDHSSSMCYPVERHGDIEHPNKLTFAIYASAVLIELLSRQRDAFGLSLLSDKIDIQTPMRSSKTHRNYLYEILQHELKVPGKEQPTSIATALHQLADTLHRRSMVILFTDALVNDDEYDALFDALRHLRHQQHEVLLFHTIHHSHEMQLSYDNRPTLFIDLENGSQVKVQPSVIAEQYSKMMRARIDDIHRHALQYRIDYQYADIEQGCDKILLPFLLKRSKMI